MKFIQHKSNNRVLGAPAGWDQKELPCDALPVTDVFFAPNTPAVQSYWKPDAGELEALAKGGCLVLSVIGVTMPPVAMHVVTE